MMDKEKVLAMSREENEGHEDERELQIATNADQIGKLCGGALVAIIVCVSLFMSTPLSAFSALAVYFTMSGSSNLYQFVHIKKKSKLVEAILDLVVGLVFIVAFIKVGFWT